MKKLIISIFILGYAFGLYAQHDPQYTHFVFNRLAYNPAYAGSKENLTIGALYRNQWSGIDGAPKTINAFMHTPFANNRNGFGIGLTSDKIGMLNTTDLALSYAYRIKMGSGATLSMGLRGELEMSSVDWSKADPMDTQDNLIGSNAANLTRPNFGAGVYYSTPKYYVGFSVPRLFKNSLYNRSSTNVLSNRDVRTYYLMGGVLTKLSDKVKFQPSVLFSVNPSAPVDMDINANFIFMDKFWVGASYRLSDSFDALVQYQLTNKLRAGFAYDFTTSPLRKLTSGSWEMMLEYTLCNCAKDQVNNPRFF